MGVARQYCGRLGKVGNCQAGMFLAYVSPLGRALVDKGLYLPESWTSDKDRCEAAGVPEDRQGYRSKTELALGMWMRQLSSRCTGHFGIFTLTSRRCLAAGRRGSTAVIISRPCWYSLGSGATLRTCRRRFRGQPEGCSGFSPILPGTMR